MLSATRSAAAATAASSARLRAVPVVGPSRPPHHRRPVARAAAAADDSAKASPVASPFSSASVHRTVGGAPPSSDNILSIASVDACLDEVRPYLIADGGDVEVVSADPNQKRVELKLRGACSSCASSDATMRMGLERAIRARFGADVTVVQVASDGGGEGGGGNCGGPARASLEAIDGHLNTLRSAVAGLGGRVRVAEVTPLEADESKQRALVYYKGPRSIGNGIKAAILERFQGDVAEVEMVDFPADYVE
jgi:Fe-S cluster biogenesis protein NfuA